MQSMVARITLARVSSDLVPRRVVVIGRPRILVVRSQSVDGAACAAQGSLQLLWQATGGRDNDRWFEPIRPRAARLVGAALMDRPDPVLTYDNEGWWLAARDGRLVIQRCEG